MIAPGRPAWDAVGTAPAQPLGMPHLDPGGLSESWLLRHAGDLHWQAITRRLEIPSDRIEDDQGQRLYPTFVALRARYAGSLAAAKENDLFRAAAEVIPCGRACAHGLVVARAGELRVRLELLSTFALRTPAGLRMAHPAARLARRWHPIEPTPHTDRLAGLARAARRGEPLADPFCGPSLAVGPVVGRVDYLPSPYADYNGAGLLYFASYVTIADTVERHLIHKLELTPPGLGDWALTTSPVQRDVFYYGNLPLGEAITAELVDLTPEGSDDGGPRFLKTRVRLCRQRGGAPMADLITRRAWHGGRPGLGDEVEA